MSVKFTQNTVHHEKGDFIKVQHLSIHGSNKEIGYKLGNLAKNQHHINRSNQKDILIHECQKQYLKANYPIHYERMTGLAKTYDENIDNTALDFSCFGNPLDALGCSAVFYPPKYTESNSGILSRNLDLPLRSFSELHTGKESHTEQASANMYVIELYPDKGYSSLINFCFELYGLALDGINSEGLTVTHLYADAINSEKYNPSMEYGIGINEMLVVQMLLDNCKSVEEAKKVLLSNKHFYMMLPTHLLIADRFGNSFVWEYSVHHNKEYIIDGNSEIQILTNFLLNEYDNPGAYPKSEDSSCPFARYKALKSAINKNTCLSKDRIKEINSTVFISDEMYSQKPKTKTRTFYHCLLDTNEVSMEISYYRRDIGNKQLRTNYFRFKLAIQRDK